MARKKSNKSQLIRDYAETHPEAKPAAIVEGLKTHKVSYALVSNVLHRARHGKKKGKRKSKSTSHSSNGFTLESLLAAKQLAQRVGGLEAAKAALQALEKLA